MAPIDPKLRSGALHLGTAVSSALATAMWLASTKTDVYALIDQINGVVVEIGKVVAMITAIATGIAQIWKSRPPALAADVVEIAKQKDTPIKGLITEDTPEGHALAQAIEGPAVVAGSVAAEVLAKSRP